MLPLIKEIKINGFCWCNVFSPDGKYLATGGHSDIQVFNSITTEKVLTLKGYTYDPMNTANNDTFAAVFSPDGRFLITGGADMIIRIWEIPSGKLFKKFEKQTSVVQDLAITYDGNTLISANFLDITIWDIKSCTKLKTIPDIKKTSSIMISPNGKIMVSGGADKILRLWQIED